MSSNFTSLRETGVQVNESHLQSIVTQPWENNYVYATGFDVLPRVRNLVLDKACRVLVTPGTTVTTTTRPTTTPTTTPPLLPQPTLIPSINGNTHVTVSNNVAISFFLGGHFLPATLVVQVQHTFACICLCVRSVILN